MKEKKTQKIGRLPLFSSKKPVSVSQKKSYFKAKLIEKQKFRKNFLLTNKQLKAFLAADKSKLTMNKATSALIARLDFFIFTVCTSNNIFCTLRGIRQRIRHGHFLVNGRREKRPNYLCLETDKITGLFPETSTNTGASDAYSIDFQNINLKR